jgi:hypothetical protein
MSLRREMIVARYLLVDRGLTGLAPRIQNKLCPSWHRGVYWKINHRDKAHACQRAVEGRVAFWHL